jgi:hypothetical protein
VVVEYFVGKVHTIIELFKKGLGSFKLALSPATPAA